MRTRLLSFIFLLVFSLLLVGCGSSSNKESGIDNGDNEEAVVELEGATPSRKIIYKVSAEITTSELSQCISEIKSNLHDDEWLDIEDVSSDYAYLVMRIKTDRLDDFLYAMADANNMTEFRKTATDISLTYQDKSNLILSYQAERTRLLELYEDASLTDMITINSRLSQLDTSISKLQGELDQFDSLVDYSEVSFRIRATRVTDSLPFGKEIADAFLTGLSALISFIRGLIIVIVVLIPWVVVFGPISYGVYRLIRRYQIKSLRKWEAKKKNNNNNNTNTNNNNT